MESEPLPQRANFKKQPSKKNKSCRSSEVGVFENAESNCDGCINVATAPSITAEQEDKKAIQASMLPQILVPIQYEYLDHTADVQFHSWGSTLEIALEQIVVCMFSYMTELPSVEELDEPIEVEVEGHDIESAVYALLDEFLYRFCVDGFVARRVVVRQLDRQGFRVAATGFGETFQPRTKHPQGTEVKAITYSAMQVLEAGGGEPAHVYVIVDI